MDDRQKKDQKKITIIDIAKKLGISPATVSNALTGERYVKKETIEKVKKMVEELHYSPNIIARALRGKKRNIIGLLTSNINNPFNAEIISGVEDVLNKKDYILVLNSTRFDAEIEKKAVMQLNNLLVDGLVFVGGMSDFSHVELVIPQNTPVVLINRKITGSRFTDIAVDYKGAFRKIVEYLHESGHQRIGYVGWQKDSSIIPEEKLWGFTEGLDRVGISENKRNIFLKNNIPIREFREYREFAREIYPLIEQEGITSLVAQTDNIALGLISGLNTPKVRIPDDISIVGCGNIAMSGSSSPPITTVHLPKIRMGRFGAEVLLGLMSKGKNKKQTIYLKTTLIKRESVRDISK